MISFISKNTWQNPLSAVPLHFQRKRLHKLAKGHSGYRGLKAKWTLSGVYFMTLWKSEEQLESFLKHKEVKDIFSKRVSHIDVSTLKMQAINFIPWAEVVELMQRNSTRLNKIENLSEV